MRVKVDYRSASREAYWNFRKEHPNIKIPFEKWVDVIYELNYAFRDYVLETGDKIKLPHGFGNITINKKKRKKFRNFHGEQRINLPIDWAKTKKEGRRIYNFNHHTEGYFFGWIWFIRSARFLGSYFWRFKVSRTTSRKIAEYIKKPNANYQNVYREWIK